jgi:hypothetical protein
MSGTDACVLDSVLMTSFGRKKTVITILYYGIRDASKHVYLCALLPFLGNLGA